MKSYPSIPRSTGQSFREFDAYVFDKPDGSNTRYEWSKKRGFYKFGTRTRMFDASDPVFGCAIDIMNNQLAEPLTKVFVDNRWEKAIVFAEFIGDKSFAGVHDPLDAKRLILFDVSVYRTGFIKPSEFVDLFSEFEFTVPFLGTHKWTRGFVDQVRRGEMPGVTLEGVVGKSNDEGDQTRSKAKTQKWIDMVKAKYDDAAAATIIDS